MIEAPNDIPTWMSIVFTVLCGLIAALITWQIAQGLNFERKMRQMRRIIDDRFSNFDNHVAASVCLAMGKISVHSHQILTTMGKRSAALNQALEHIAQAFENINGCEIKDNIPSAYEALDSTLSMIEAQISTLMDIETATIQRIIRVVMQDTSNNDNIDKIAMLDRLLEVQRKLELLKDVDSL